MTRDYARRPKRAGSGRQRRTPKEPRSAFNAPSFSAGVISGAALVLLASYAPQVFDETVVAIREEVAEPAPEIDFVFPDILANDTVTIDPEAYPASFPEEDEDAKPTEFLIQAASLKNPAAASDLSARLAELGLKARYERVDVNSEIWYRVMVGPFRTRVEADRAMTELRKRDLGPRLIRLS